MGNPIQYCNTDNPSQIQGWVSHNKGGFIKWLQYAPRGLIIMPLSLWYAPRGVPRGVNENFSPGPEPEQRETIGVGTVPVHVQCERFYHTTHLSMSQSRSLSQSRRQPV